jgi:hypothetical protein
MFHKTLIKKMYPELIPIAENSLAYYEPDRLDHMATSPIFAEEWHVRPPVYDLYINQTPIIKPISIPNKIEDPRDYPYGQYLTTTNLLPGEEKKVDLFCNKKSSALAYMNGQFTQQEVAFRENISRILKKKLHRRFRNDCYDLWSPYNSF